MGRKTHPPMQSAHALNLTSLCTQTVYVVIYNVKCMSRWFALQHRLPNPSNRSLIHRMRAGNSIKHVASHTLPLTNGFFVMWDAAIPRCLNRTSWGKTAKRRTGNQTAEGAELLLVFLFPVKSRQRFQKGILQTVFLCWPVYTVFIWNLYSQ